MGHKQKAETTRITRARHEQTLIFRVLYFVFFRVTRVVNDFLCPNVVSFDLVQRREPQAAEGRRSGCVRLKVALYLEAILTLKRLREKFTKPL